jgi:tetratricopeptide (TPR) repeat protein
MSIRLRVSAVFLALGLNLIISGCGPGQLFGPTKTPTPTNTLTPTKTPTPTNTLTPTPLVCEDSISSEFSGVIEEITGGSTKDPQRHLACAQLVIDNFAEAADAQEAAKKASNCDYTPDTNSKQAVDDFNAAYGVLNDVGTAWLLKGIALEALGKPDEAQAAYGRAVYDCWCAYIQNSYGGYWSVRKLGENLIKPSY